MGDTKPGGLPSIFGKPMSRLGNRWVADVGEFEAVIKDADSAGRILVQLTGFWCTYAGSAETAARAIERKLLGLTTSIVAALDDAGKRAVIRALGGLPGCLDMMPDAQDDGEPGPEPLL